MSKKFKLAQKIGFINFLHKHELITNSQFRVLKQISTSDVINYLTDLINNGIISREPISCILVDIEK